MGPRRWGYSVRAAAVGHGRTTVEKLERLASGWGQDRSLFRPQVHYSAASMSAYRRRMARAQR